MHVQLDFHFSNYLAIIYYVLVFHHVVADCLLILKSFQDISYFKTQKIFLSLEWHIEFVRTGIVFKPRVINKLLNHRKVILAEKYTFLL